MKKSTLILAAALTLAACTKQEISAPTSDTHTLYAQIEQDTATKTYIDEDNNIRWSEGDQVVAFMKSPSGLQYQILPISVGNTFASFENISGSEANGTEWEHNVVYYPYSDAVKAQKTGSNYSLSVVLPAEQTYAEESFGNGAMAMVAVSEYNNITFRNVLGGMKLQFKGTQKVASITLQGKNSEKLSGAATVTAYTDDTKPVITMSDDASTSVTLNCGGVQLNENTATEFIIALPPVLFSKGFTITVTDSDSHTYTAETDKNNEVLRSSLLVMPPVSLESGSGNVTKEGDYVDEYGVNHGQGTEIDGVVWAPVNCGYHKDDFKYGKLYQWGRKYGQGYYDGLASSGADQSYPYGDNLLSYPVEPSVGQSSKNGEKFYYMTDSPKDWSVPDFDDYWNLGDDTSPIKTEYDPCPEGWRVPTLTELSSLTKNKSDWTTNEMSQNGYWLYGQNSDYSENSPRVFLPAAGYHTATVGILNRRSEGRYWSSSPRYWQGEDRMSYYFRLSGTNLYAYVDYRANGYSVRCVQDDSELIPVESIVMNQAYMIVYADPAEAFSLNATISPANTTHQSVYWHSDDTSVVLPADDKGTMIAVSQGSAIITAMAGMKIATCYVTILPKPEA